MNSSALHSILATRAASDLLLPICLKLEKSDDVKVLENPLLSCEGDVNIVFTKAFDRLCMRALHSKLATTIYDETHNSKLDIEHTKYNTK